MITNSSELEGYNGGGFNGGEKCLICNIKCDHEPQSESGGILLEEDLNVYFLLKHVLGLPSEQLENYLRHCPQRPMEWVRICEACGLNYVGRCKSIFGELMDVKRRFNEARYQLIEAIKRSPVNGEGRKINVEGETYILDILKESRDFVLKNAYGHSNIDTFIAGDLLATQKLEVQQQTKAVAESPEDQILYRTEKDVQQLPINYDQKYPDHEDHDIEIKQEASLPEDESEEKVNFGVIGDGEDGTGEFHLSSDPDDLQDDWDAASDDVSESGTDFSETEEGPNSLDQQKSVKRHSVRKRVSSSDNEKLKSPKITRKRGRPKKLDLSQNKQKQVYPCDQCNQEFRKPSKLRHHQIRIHKTNLYECSECGWKTVTTHYPALLAHMRRFHGDKKDLQEFTCPQCQNVFASQTTLRYHILYSHEKRKKKLYHCEYCGKALTSRRSYLNHRGNIHGIKDGLRFACSFENCEKSFSTRTTLRNHEDSHKEPQYECQICMLAFQRKLAYQRHVKCHSAEKLKPFQCDLCPSSFTRDYNLKSHKQIAHKNAAVLEAGSQEAKETGPWRGVERTDYKCSECGLSFMIRNRLQQHKEKMHGPGAVNQTEPKPEPKMCQVCGKLLRTQRLLNIHMVTQHERKKVYPCQLCSVKCDKRSSLNLHMKKEHSDNDADGKQKEPAIKYVKCSDCDMSFVSIRELKNHCEISHERKNREIIDGAFPCSVCEAILLSKSSLERHVEDVHEMKNQVCCEQCGKILHSHYYMKMHLYKVHKIGNLNLPRVACTVDGCGKTFDGKTYLKRHVIRDHQGQRPYQCDWCGKRVISWTHLRRHIEAMHTNRESKPFKCDECGKGFAVKEYLWLHKKTHQPKRKDKEKEQLITQL